ncbi:hypothetical protein CON84_00430 [Bacillus sp. AFS094228]|nr:hypothetical protein CON84_00430 [Bacillus sp. AFS094228]
MPFNMNLWKVEQNKLHEIQKNRLDSENRLENWIAEDNNILGLDILIIGKQVVTSFGGRIDLLAIKSDGDLVLLELKKDRTPRDVIAQALDYASWVKGLTTVEIEAIAVKYLKHGLKETFENHFETSLPLEINNQHSIVIVASELDQSSERIVQYLADEYNVNINCVFFNFFKDNTQELLGRSWLMDPEAVEDKVSAKKTAPWSGIYYVNVGDGIHRSWEDCKTYGFISAGQHPRYSDHMKKLQVGDKVLAYLKGRGYVGYGIVTSEAVMVKDFEWTSGKKLLSEPLKQPNIANNLNDSNNADWTVGIKWIESLDANQALTQPGIFANQNIVCKLRDKATLEFLGSKFKLD